MTEHSLSSTVWSPAVVREEDGGAVLVVDFQRLSAGRDAVDVAADAFPGRTILRFDPISALETQSRPVSLVDMAGRVSAGMQSAGWVPELVVGYCSATPLAMHLVRHFATFSEIPLALLAPGFPTWEQVEGDLSEILKTLNGSDPVIALAREPQLATTEIAAALDSALQVAVEGMGLSGSEALAIRQDLGARYRAWLGYLVSAVVADAPVVTTDLSVQQMPEPWAKPHGGWPSHARLWRIHLPRESLLDSDQTIAVLRRAGEEML